MKKVIEALDLENLPTTTILDLLSSRTHKLSEIMEQDLTGELWKRYPFYIMTTIARDLEEIKQVLVGITQTLVQNGLLEAPT